MQSRDGPLRRWLGGRGKLAAEGRQVLVTDLAEEAALQASVTKLRETRRRRTSTWWPRARRFCPPSWSSPTRRPPTLDNPYLQTAWETGATVTTEIARTLDQLKDRKTIAITGRCGQKHQYRHDPCGTGRGGDPATRGGNLGESLIGTPKEHTLVVELSSAMAWWLYEAPKAPRPTFDVALRTNLAPNHLDWHGDMTHYARCKQAILDHAKVALDGSILPPYEGELLVPGHHNRINAAAACRRHRRHPIVRQRFRRGLACLQAHRLERLSSRTSPTTAFERLQSHHGRSRRAGDRRGSGKGTGAVDCGRKRQGPTSARCAISSAGASRPTPLEK